MQSPVREPPQQHYPSRSPPGCTSLPASKTGHFRKGVTLTIAHSPIGGDPACPVTSMLHSLRKFPSYLDASPFTPNYMQLGSDDGLDAHYLPGAAFGRAHVVGGLRRLLFEAGIQGNYPGHSFRRGAAGLHAEDIQLLGRCKSEAHKRYIQVHPEPSTSHPAASKRRHPTARASSI